MIEGGVEERELEIEEHGGCEREMVRLSQEEIKWESKRERSREWRVRVEIKMAWDQENITERKRDRHKDREKERWNYGFHGLILLGSYEVNSLPCILGYLLNFT